MQVRAAPCTSRARDRRRSDIRVRHPSRAAWLPKELRWQHRGHGAPAATRSAQGIRTSGQHPQGFGLGSSWGPRCKPLARSDGCCERRDTDLLFFRKSAGATPGLRTVAIIGAIAISTFTAISVRHELTQRTYTSLTQRARIEHATHRLWLEHPFTGVGLRFFKTPQYTGYSPPNNVFDEILAEAGVLGLAGFVVFVVGSLRGLGRLQGDLATAGLCVVSARFTHGLFDIYWTGGTTALVWIVAGMGLAAALAAEQTSSPGT